MYHPIKCKYEQNGGARAHDLFTWGYRPSIVGTVSDGDSYPTTLITNLEPCFQEGQRLAHHRELLARVQFPMLSWATIENPHAFEPLNKAKLFM